MNIIVNGGSRGIGIEIARNLAEDRKNKIIVTGRNEEALKKLSRTASHKNISYIIIDLAGPDLRYETIKDKVYSYFRTIDIVINNAGSLVSKNFIDTSDEDARSMMEVNFFAPASLIKILLPLMKPGSHIVNIASMGGFQGSAKFKGLSYYSASKAAMACLTECLALELNEFGISVNCLALGSVQTEMLREAFPGYKAPVDAKKMGEFIADFALNGNKVFNGKILPVALTTP
jgi:short-subunit dehydrogenase